MSLADVYKLLGPAVSCKTCQWYNKLTDDDKAFFDERLHSGVAMRKLWTACRGYGLDVVESSFRSHVHDHTDRDKKAQHR